MGVWADPLRMKNVAGLLLLFFCLILTDLVAGFKMAGLFKTHLSLGNLDDSLAGLGFLITKHQRNNFLKGQGSKMEKLRQQKKHEKRKKRKQKRRWKTFVNDRSKRSLRLI